MDLIYKDLTGEIIDAAFVGKRGCNPSGIIEDWSAWLHEPDKQEELDILRRNTHKGLPCGKDSFVKRLETLLNRSLSFRPRGRPKKEKKKCLLNCP